MPRFAANLSTLFTERPFAQRFQAAADCGFTAVEFLFPYDFAPDAVAGWAQAAGVSIELFNLPPGDWAAGERGLAALPGREAQFQASVDAALAYAQALSVPRLHVMAGQSSAGAERSTYCRNLDFAAKRAGAQNIDVLIEPLNPRSMPDYFLADLQHALAVIEEVGAPNLKLQADLFHLAIIHGDVGDILRRHIGAIGHVQIASVPDRHEPGQGTLDYRFVFALLDELGYSRWIGCEYHPRGRTEDGLGWMRELA